MTEERESVVLIDADGTLIGSTSVQAGISCVNQPVLLRLSKGFGQRPFFRSGERDATGRAIFRNRLQ